MSNLVNAAIDILLGEVHYTDIGHSGKHLIFFWLYDGNQLHVEKSYPYDDHDQVFGMDSADSVAYGRVDPETGIGTFTSGDSDKRVLKRAIESVVDRFQGIKFIVFPGEPFSRSKSLLDYYQLLGDY